MVVVPIDADLDQPRITGLESSTEEDCSNKAQTPLSKPLPLWRKLAFAAGGLPMQMMQNIIAFFLPIFCLETVNLDPSYLSAILLVARVSDALTDPIMGFLVLKTRSRFGQKRPWILFSTPIFVGSFFALFYAVSWSDVAKLCLYITSIVMLQVGLTSFHVPYSSMTIVLTNIPTERDTLTAFRMFSEVLAILLGVSVFGAIIAQHRVATTCEESVYLNATSPEQVIVSPEAKQLEAWSYVTAASVTCAIGAAAALICFFGTREVNNSEEPSTKEEDVGFFKSVRLVLTYRPYLLHMGAFLFLSLGIQFVQGNLSLYITHSLKMSGYMIPGITALLATTILVVPFAQFLLRRLGKKTTLAMGTLNAFPLLLLLLFLPERPPVYVFFAMMIWAAFTIAVAMLLPWSMLPDVIDAFYLEHNMRLEAVFYSLIVFFNKFAVGISLAMSAGVLDLVGYNSKKEACIQVPEVGRALRFLSSVVSVAFLVPALIFLYFYPLGNQKLSEMRLKLLSQSNASTQDIDRSDVTINSTQSAQRV